jgi:hypothetical protein
MSIQPSIQDAGGRASRSQYNHQRLSVHDSLQNPTSAASYLFSGSTPSLDDGSMGSISAPIPSMAVIAKGTVETVCFVAPLSGGTSGFEFFNLFFFSEL